VRWMAPETLDPEIFGIPALPDRGFSAASDIYAFAMVIIEIFTGNVPFQEFHNEPSVIIKVMRGERPKRPEREHAPGLSDQLWDLAQMCWHQDRSKRPTIFFVLDSLEVILDSTSSPTLSAAEISSSGCEDARRSFGSCDTTVAFIEKKIVLSTDYKDVAIRNRLTLTKWPKRCLRFLLPCVNW